MKGHIKKLCFIFGTFFLTSAFVWIYFISPKILKIPENFFFTANIVSVDNFFSENTGEYSGEIYSKTKYSYEAIKNESGILTIKNVFSVKTPSGEPVFNAERFYGIDQVTGMHVYGHGDKDREGYLFAPRRLTSNDKFTYWHVNYDGPANMVYVGDDKLYGLKVLRFKTNYEGVVIDQTANLSFLPGVGKTKGVELEPYLELWIEPVTGKIIKYKDDTVAYFYDLKTRERLNPWNHFSNTFDEQSVAFNVDVVKWDKIKTNFFERHIPLFLILFSVLFFVKCGFTNRFFSFLSLDKIRRVVAFVVIFISAISLFGWVVGSESLIRIFPNGAAMNPVTALCFLLMGFSFLFIYKFDGRLVVYIGFLVALVGLFRFLNSVGVFAFSPDLIIFKDLIFSYSFPARMSEYTAFSFVLLGLVPLISKIKKIENFRLEEIFPALVFLLSLVSIVNFILSSTGLFSLPFFFSSAIHTTFLFIIISSFSYVYYRRKVNQSIGSSGLLLLSGILTFSLLVTILFASIVHVFITNEARGLFLEKVDSVTNDIDNRLAIYINTIRGAEGILSASQNVDREEWKTYINSLEVQKNFPGIQGIGYSIFIDQKNLESHIQSIKSEGFSNYKINPEGIRDTYSSVIYIEPFDERNRQAFGYDMFTNIVRRSAMEQARDSGEPRMSGKVTLVQEIDNDNQPGFLIYVPHYKNGFPHSTINERQKNIVGYAYAPFRARNFIEGIIGKNGIEGVGLMIEDGVSNEGSEAVLYDDTQTRLVSRDLPRFEDKRVLYIAGRPWFLTFKSSSSFAENMFTRLIVPVIILLGILVSLLFSFVFYLLNYSKQRALSYADQITKDLKNAKKQVENKLSETERLNKFMINRELKMIELKKEIEILKKDNE